MFSKSDGPTALRADLVRALSFSVRQIELDSDDGPQPAVAAVAAVWNGKKGFVAVLVRWVKLDRVDRYVAGDPVQSESDLASATEEALGFAESLGFSMDPPDYAELDPDAREQRVHYWNKVRKVRRKRGAAESGESSGASSSPALGASSGGVATPRPGTTASSLPPPPELPLQPQDADAPRPEIELEIPPPPPGPGDLSGSAPVASLQTDDDPSQWQFEDSAGAPATGEVSNIAQGRTVLVETADSPSAEAANLSTGEFEALVESVTPELEAGAGADDGGTLEIEPLPDEDHAGDIDPDEPVTPSGASVAAAEQARLARMLATQPGTIASPAQSEAGPELPAAVAGARSGEAAASAEAGGKAVLGRIELVRRGGNGRATPAARLLAFF